MKPPVKTIAHQPSWVLRNNCVEAAITQLGAHMAPVTFYRGGGDIQPYYVNPWHGEGRRIDEPCLIPLRGDFFCLPFGAAGTWRGVNYNTHGDPAARGWKFLDLSRRDGLTTLAISQRMRLIPGRVTRFVHLLDGQNVVYDTNVVEGVEGRYSCGHHATLAMPQQERSVLIGHPPMRLMHTNPIDTGDPAQGRYQALATNQPFRRLSKAPTLWKDPAWTDGSALPARRGFTDILAMVNRPRPKVAWWTATYTVQGFLWFALKDPAVLPLSLMWIANRGRHNEPWRGRNVCLGMEDICAFFASGQGPSFQRNFLNERGIPTTIRFSSQKPTAIHYIQGLAKAPRGFGRCTNAKFAPGKVMFAGQGGKTVTVQVNHEFLESGLL
jgi:hypothetical protein